MWYCIRLGLNNCDLYLHNYEWNVVDYNCSIFMEEVDMYRASFSNVQNIYAK